MEENYKQEFANCVKVVLFGPESTGKNNFIKTVGKILQLSLGARICTRISPK